MPRIPRKLILYNNCIFHITWKCHNNDFLLDSPWAKKLYYNLLIRFKDRYQIKFFSYCLMGNHPHLTGSCKNKELLSDFFRIVNSLFAKAYNKKYSRRGQVVMDRFKSPTIQTDSDLLKVMQYIDLNPKRAGIVKHPHYYAWSSYAYYAYGKQDLLITAPELYLNMGPNPKTRQKLYRNMVEFILKNDWKKKQPYSSVSFIGNPAWVLKKAKTIKALQKLQRENWRRKFNNRFNLRKTLIAT